MNQIKKIKIDDLNLLNKDFEIGNLKNQNNYSIKYCN